MYKIRLMLVMIMRRMHLIQQHRGNTQAQLSGFVRSSRKVTMTREHVD
jgi:hypothetical protein